MPRRHPRPDEDVAVLAETLRARWKPADGIEPWLRRNAKALTRLVRVQGWTWRDVGRALTVAGITYESGRPWNHRILTVKVSEARAALRVQAAQRAAVETPLKGKQADLPMPVVAMPPETAAEEPAFTLTTPPAPKRPKFVLAQLANYQDPPHNPASGTDKEPASMPAPGKADVEAVMRRFFGEADTNEE